MSFSFWCCLGRRHFVTRVYSQSNCSLQTVAKRPCFLLAALFAGIVLNVLSARDGSPSKVRCLALAKASGIFRLLCCCPCCFLHVYRRANILAKFCLSVIGGNSPNFDMLGIVQFLNRLVQGDLLSPDSFVYGSFDA